MINNMNWQNTLSKDYNTPKKENATKEEIEKAEDLLKAWYESLPIMEEFVKKTKENRYELQVPTTKRD